MKQFGDGIATCYENMLTCRWVYEYKRVPWTFPEQNNPEHKNPKRNNPNLFSGIYVKIPNPKRDLEGERD